MVDGEGGGLPGLREVGEEGDAWSTAKEVASLVPPCVDGASPTDGDAGHAKEGGGGRRGLLRVTPFVPFSLSRRPRRRPTHPRPG
jgi:hypothetical protein